MKMVLMVEDNPGDARLLREMFNDQGGGDAELTHVERMSEAEIYLSKHAFDIILLDLRLPDAQGLGAVRRARTAAPHVALVVLTGLDDESLAAQALQEGAQDYLVKGKFESFWFFRAMRYAIERHRIETQLRESTQLFRATLDAASFAIVNLDPEQRVLIWNRAAERMFGYSNEELSGRPYPLIPEDGRAEFDALYRRVVSGETVRNVRLQHRRKDGALREVVFAAAPLDEGGRVRAVVASLEDITDRTVLETNFIQAQKMEAIGNLTGGMAHDFNNLLGVIIGNLDLLRPMLAPRSESLELADDSLDAALRGAELTRRLLAFARRQPLAPQPVELNELISSIVKLLARMLGEQVAIDLDLAGSLWPVVVDAMQLEAAITNLATNARDAMPNGGGLSIATANCRLDEDYAALHPELMAGDYVMIMASDTGIGMAPEVMARIFDPFFTTKQEGNGTGLGLSMVFGFMRQSGGHINVRSEPGYGTTFRLYLPRSPVAWVDAEAPPKSDAAAGAGRETVLAVEDNAALRRVVVRQLTDLGYRVIEADGPAAALEVMAKEEIDLLFSDVVMPGALDGYALSRQVLALRPSIKIVLTSGFPATHVIDTFAPPASAVRLLSKPYRRDELARAIRQTLDA
jgi:PAS domain S-box-containing protein